jgi:hypothetical protein
MLGELSGMEPGYGSKSLILCIQLVRMGAFAVGKAASCAFCGDVWAL